MKKILSITFLSLLLCQILYSQQQNRIGETLKSHFENFEYDKVIAIGDSLLIYNANLSKEDSIQIFYYKAISAFHMWDINLSEENFRNLLKLDQNFKLDSSTVSPKIISFFNQLKKRELEEVSKSKNQYEINNQKENTKKENSFNNFSIYKESIWKNLLIPGWGNFVLNQKSKGYLFTISYSLSLISTIYFSYITAKKENEYLNETIPERITEKYKSYNTYYKLKNISIGALSLVYLYSQIDFFSNLNSNALPQITFDYNFKSVNFSLKVLIN
ncbi:MAG: hypothetical protein N3F03_02590 [Ignavibacteria bacterium]|nr:hypothetical protein [Ignavibacteria bacterium]